MGKAKRKGKNVCVRCSTEKIYDGDILEITTIEFDGENENRKIEKARVILDGKDLKLQFDERIELLDYIDCSKEENANRFFDVVDNIYGEYHIIPLEVLNTGYEFYRAVRQINNGWEIAYPKLSVAFIIPITVNISFACELFFKGLLLLEDKDFSESHNVEKLFKQLNGKTQNKIFDIVNFDYVCDSGKSITKKQFNEALKAIKDYFVTQRYSFEKRENEREFEYGLGISFIKKLCDAILLVVNSRIESYFAYDLLIDDTNKVQKMKEIL